MDFDRILAHVFMPTTTSELSVYYLFWVVLYFATNVVWDIKSQRTPEFHISDIKEKIKVLYSASTAASSILLLVSLLSPAVAAIAVDKVVPILLAGMSGIIFSVSELCPYDKKVAPAKVDPNERK